jgi:hypothetical protein
MALLVMGLALALLWMCSLALLGVDPASGPIRHDPVRRG